MIPAKTLREIAEQLLAKSQANEVVWKREDVAWDPDADPLGGSEMPFRPVNAPSRLRKTHEYVLQLPESQVRLHYVQPTTSPDYVLMRVCRKDGVPVGCLRAEDGEPDWELLSALYAEADRSVVGWGNVLAD